MGHIAPIAVAEKNAAKMLDMRPNEFRNLVNEGILPRPRKVGPFERWDADELKAVMRGDGGDGFEDVKW
jgi:predicted DNA-binding transcriptional regulator AlpA